jgi:hypothetical protein
VRSGGIVRRRDGEEHSRHARMCGWSVRMPRWAGAEPAGFGPVHGAGRGGCRSRPSKRTRCRRRRAGSGRRDRARLCRGGKVEGGGRIDRERGRTRLRDLRAPGSVGFGDAVVAVVMEARRRDQLGQAVEGSSGARRSAMRSSRAGTRQVVDETGVGGAQGPVRRGVVTARWK